MPTTERPPGSRAPLYGIDAPYVPVLMGMAGIVAIALGFIAAEATWMVVVGLLFLAQTALYLHTTLRGKFVVWQGLLDELGLRGDEQLLDLGCGRGAVLLAAARRLPEGRAHGVDLWRSRDQSGNDEATTARNAEIEGVRGRVELHTGDITDLPFPDGGFDIVTSSLAIHNLPSAELRRKAVDEALRVLGPGGRLAIADIRGVGGYADRLREAGATEVATRRIGPNGWFGGPWQGMSVVTARAATGST